MLERHAADTTRLDQRAHGGPAEKLTMLGTIVDGLTEGALLRDGKHKHERAYGKDRETEIFVSRRLQT